MPQEKLFITKPKGTELDYVWNNYLPLVEKWLKLKEYNAKSNTTSTTRNAYMCQEVEWVPS